MKTLLRNWDVEGHYEFGFGCGFYFSGKRQITKKGVTTAVPYNHEKQIKTFEETLAKMAASAKAEGGCPFIIVDDASPVEVEPERIAEIVGENPMLYLRVDENVGVGGKENILQRALVDRCKYVLKFDVDVQFDSMPLDKIRKGFKTLADAWTITTCIAYFALRGGEASTRATLLHERHKLRLPRLQV